MQDSNINRDGKELREDLIWRIKTTKGEWLYLYILFEFQSTCDNWMAIRVLEYIAVFWHGLVKTGAIKKDDFLPPVLPIVMYNGKSEWTAKRDIYSLLPNLKKLLKQYQPNVTYFLLDENNINKDKIKKNSLFTPIIKLEQANDLKSLSHAIQEALRLYKSDDFNDLRRNVVRWIKEVALKRAKITNAKIDGLNDLQELRNMLAENMDIWYNDVFQKGRDAGIKESKISFDKRIKEIIAEKDASIKESKEIIAENKERIKEIIIGMLKLNIPIENISNITNISITEINMIKSQLNTCK